MFKTNRERRKKLILSYQDTRRIYYLIKIIEIYLILFICFIVIMGVLSNNNQKNIKNKLFGSWNIVVLNIDNSELSYYKNHAYIKNYSIHNLSEKIFLNDSQRLIIGESDENFLSLANIKILQGEMPTKAHEVAIEQKYTSTLGVKKVGDIISEQCVVKSLRGYTVCGIVEDYSDRWKMVNWDVDFINCFVKKVSNFQRTQIFIECEENVKKDIEINALSSKENIQLVSIPILDLILRIVIVFSILVIILNLILYKKYYSNRNYTSELSNINSTLYKIILLVLLLLSSFFIVFILNNIICHSNYLSEVHINQSIDSERIFSNIGNMKYIFHNGLFREAQYIPNRNIISLVKIYCNFIWLMLINSIICFINFCLFDQKISRKKEILYLSEYYYGRSLRLQKEFYLYQLLELEIEIVLFLTICYLYYGDNRMKVIFMFIGMISIIALFFIRFCIIKRKILAKINLYKNILD